MVEARKARSEQHQQPHEDKLPINEWLLKHFTRHDVELELPDRGDYRPVPFYDYDRDAILDSNGEANVE
ncbi:MAG: hypothetical protein OXC55_03685 [Chloroflexi bacterium]|nr:hypothetical protein [Chloroflexota bacterium]